MQVGSRDRLDVSADRLADVGGLGRRDLAGGDSPKLQRDNQDEASASIKVRGTPI